MRKGVKSERKDNINTDKWVDLYGNYLYKYAILRLNDGLLAEDLVQETFLAALKAYETFKGKSLERTWLLSILKHKIIDNYRKVNRQSIYIENDSDFHKQSGDYQENGQWLIDRAPSYWGENPDESLEQIEFIETLHKCLSDLPARIATVFTLREIDELDSEDICKILNITSSNLWVRLHRARSQLRRCLEINWYGKTK